MRDRASDRSGGNRRGPRPFRVRLPGFIAEETIGLGDAIARASRTFGVKPCGGCKRRAAALNRWLVFTRRGR